MMSRYAPAKLDGIEGIGFIEITGEEKPFNVTGEFTLNDVTSGLHPNLREAEFEGKVWYGDNCTQTSVIVTTRIISIEPITYEVTLKYGISLEELGFDTSHGR